MLDLDKIGKNTLKEGEGIQMSDHPGFNDKGYKKRRKYISSVAMNYNIFDTEIPRIDYIDSEKEVWKSWYLKFKKYYEKGACKQ